jgi:2-polyprenyl-6-methoxyphenol hydroxylase-like FAD-dependent oxidoreductase
MSAPTGAQATHEGAREVAGRLFDVAVVGAGPVGLALAALVGRRGWEVVVLERRPVPYPLPRAVHFDHEVARILQGLGVMGELAAVTEPMDAYEWRSANGATLLTFGVEGLSGPSGWPSSTMFSQPDLEAALVALVDSLPSVSVRRGDEVAAIEQSEEQATLSLLPAGGGRPGTVSARFVLGCDGAQSTVRGLLGTPVEDWGYFFDWLIVDVLPRDARPWRPLNVQICDPARPTTAVSGGPGRRRFEFMRLPDEPVEALATEETAWRLLEPWGLGPETATLERYALYTFAASLVERWRDGRVLLAGDAAHQMPPFAGQGLCSGLRDAANLAWKLDLVLGGHAPDRLLDTYGTERAPQVRAEIEFSVDLGKVICVTDPAEAAVRDEAMTAAVRETGPVVPPPEPPIGPGVTRPSDPGAGELCAQGIVEIDGRRGRLDDLVGAGWLLLSRAGDPADGLPFALLEWFARIGGLMVVLDDGPVTDVEGTYAAWMGSLGAGVVLQRPDFHIFGCAPGIEGTPALLADLAAALGADGTRGGAR